MILPLALVVLMGMGCSNGTTSGETPSSGTNTGDENSDFVDNETWTSTINIVWDGTDVTVTGSADGVTVKSSNGYVTITSTVKNIEYAVSGNGTGQLTIYSDYKFKLSLEGLTLACSDGPAINNQSSKTCYAVLGGTFLCLLIRGPQGGFLQRRTDLFLRSRQSERHRQLQARTGVR